MQRWLQTETSDVQLIAPLYFIRRTTATAGLLLAAFASCGAEQVRMPPETPPVVQAHRLTVAPQLDGQVLDDAAWTEVQPASGFWQVRPTEGHPASQRTSVFIGFTDDALYVGVICYDDNPEGIIVADSRRDSSLRDTDSFQIIFDSFQDRQNGFVFGTNPAGIEYDGQVTKESEGGFTAGGGGFNRNWDTSWTVKASISDIGWSAEMEIPFKSLRYGPEEIQTWGVNFQRNIARNKEIVFWSPLSRQHNLYRISDAGTIDGLELPRQRNLKVTPYILGQASRGGELPDGTVYNNEVGVDAKYSITPSLTLDLTYNTDFAQVEVDEQQVDLNRFSLFFPEKRAFFLENAGQFAVGNSDEVELFFSRRIGISDSGEPIPIAGGIRLSGKVGAATNVGLLYMRTDEVAGVTPGNEYTVARVNQELQNRSSMGALFVSRKGDGSLLPSGSSDQNQTYALDGRWGIGDHIDLSAWAAKTDTPGLTGKDDAYALGANYSSAEWSGSLAYRQVGGDFNPEVGFLDRNDYRKYEGFILRRIRPDDLWGLHELRPHISYRGYWNLSGFQETGFLHIDNHWEYKSGVEFHTGVNFTHEGVTEPFEIVDGVVIEPGTYKNQEVQLVYDSDESTPFGFDLRLHAGGFFSGDKTTLRPTLRYRIGETFNSELSWSYNDIALPLTGGDFRVNVGQLNLSYSFTPKMMLQALIQYDDRNDVIATNIRFAWLQSANAGLFVVYNEVDERGIGAPPDKGREFVLKYSHIFDLLD